MGLLSLALARHVTFGLTLLFSIIVLGLGAHAVYTVNTYYADYFAWSALAIAVAVITIVSIVPMHLIEFMRRGAFTSLVYVEVAWLSVLWVLWLATGALAANENTFVFGTDGCSYASRILSTFCSEWAAVEAFSFLTWIILMAYTITLVVFAFQGRRAWKGTVRDVPANEPAAAEMSQPQSMPMNTTHASPYPASAAPTTSYPNSAAPHASPMGGHRAEV